MDKKDDTLRQMVAGYFAGDMHRTNLWFATRNPNFGNVSPNRMIASGLYENLRKFVVNAVEENGEPL